MARASGYVLVLSRDRLETCHECFEADQSFAEPVAEFKHSRSVPLVCFVVGGRKVTHIAMGKRGTRAGTDLRRLNLERADALPVPLPIQRVIKRVPRRNAASVRKRLTYGGLLTEKGFDAVAEAIRQLAPQASVILERYSRARVERVARLSSKARANLAQQKEAVLTALWIADLSRESLQEWSPAESAPTSFLDGLPTVRLREDPMVIHDMMHVPGHEVIKTYPFSAAVFESETTSERLTVILANRLPLEQQTGTDLIYFNEAFQSFVMVQYKAMDRATRKNGAPLFLYRLPDAQLKEEIDRMDAMLGALKACTPNKDIGGFRLSENPFFLKLCPRLLFNPDTTSLVPGMYLPLDYWKLLEKDPGIIGPKGGMRITYDNAKRYFDNTSFVTVVSKAWIGTTPNQSMVLQDVIREVLETGKAVAIAIKPRTSAKPHPDEDEDIEEEEASDD